MLKKKLWVTAMLSLLLVACQDEANPTEEQKSLNVEETVFRKLNLSHLLIKK